MGLLGEDSLLPLVGELGLLLKLGLGLSFVGEEGLDPLGDFSLTSRSVSLGLEE